MKAKIQPIIVKCRICGDSRGPLYKDSVNNKVYLCKKCKDLVDYERCRHKKEESNGVS